MARVSKGDRFAAGLAALQRWIEKSSGSRDQDDQRLERAELLTKLLRGTARKADVQSALAMIEELLGASLGTTGQDCTHIEHAVATVECLMGKSIECRADGPFRGPVCPACLCCRGCAAAYDYAPNGRATGKPCPGCGLGPTKEPKRAKRRQKARAS